MSRRLIFLNVLFLGVGVAAAVTVVRELAEPPARPPASRARPATPSAPPTLPASPATATPPGGYSAVAARNLFSPTRSEISPATTAQALRPTPPAPKPNLHGVVLRDGTPIAYMEDPTTRRTAGYRLGDFIAGGTVQAIHADRVVLTRPDGNIDVRLRDPAKPRPPAQAAVPPRPGIPIGVPGTVPPPGSPPTLPPTVQPGFQPPQIPGFPQRRPLPPSVLRRVPPPTSDAAQQ